jgi:hypothetical protein
MGSWGYGPFDNDAAADLVLFVRDAGPTGWRVVKDALYSTHPQDIVGAAEIIATALGLGTRRGEWDFPVAADRGTIVSWVRKYGRGMPSDLPALALDACRRVLAHSRKSVKKPPKKQRTLAGMKLLNVFIDEGDGARQWQATVNSLIRRLERGRRRRQS